MDLKLKNFTSTDLKSKSEFPKATKDVTLYASWKPVYN